MEFLLEIFFFALGTIIASFVGVVAGRLNTGTSIVSGRSKCDACGEVLGVSSLVPIFSWLMTKGRARCCSARISSYSPLFELLFGVLFVLSYAMLGLTLALGVFLIALALLGTLVLYDLAHQILPPLVLVLFVLTSIAFAVVAPDSAGQSWVFGIAFVLGGLLALIHFVSGGRAMGLSDAPLAFALSVLVGSFALAGFVISFWIGAVIGIVMLWGRPRGHRIGVEVPFAPFLAAGYLVAFFTQWNPFDAISLLAELLNR